MEITAGQPFRKAFSTANIGKSNSLNKSIGFYYSIFWKMLQLKLKKTGFTTAYFGKRFSYETIVENRAGSMGNYISFEWKKQQLYLLQK
ncbi:MAG: hypothetical protein MI784_06620 [Cytophagales bacterium]|nr:hypothetical protein [Cytophagales bacterium]